MTIDKNNYKFNTYPISIKFFNELQRAKKKIFNSDNLFYI